MRELISYLRLESKHPSSLDLSRKSIGDEGANSVFQALRVNTSLTSLDWSDSSISD